MDKNELINLTKEELAEAILNMGHIIRVLDENSEYLEYWTQDGEYITYIPSDEVRRHLGLYDYHSAHEGARKLEKI